MPTYSITLRVNVPGLGQRDVPYTGITAPSMQAAVEQVKQNVIIKPILVEETAA
jgi:hypothetical protein